MKVAFVGGGVGALTSALLLSAQGADVTIYEMSSKLGGRLAYQEGEGYRIDQGPTIVLLPEMLLGILEECGIERSRLSLLACDPMYKIHYADGTVLSKYSSEERQAEEIERVFPGESDGFRKYMKDTRPLFEQGSEAFLERTFLRKSQFFTWSTMKYLVKARAYRSARHYASRYFKDERLKDAFSLQTLYIGGAPFQTPALYTLLPYAEHEFGVWYLKGGYASLVGLMQEELERRGARILLESPVDKLIVKDGRCIGISAKGKEEHYDSVVYNGEFPHLKPLLPSDVSLPARSYHPSSGCVLVYLGIGRRYEHAPAHQFFLPGSLMKELQAVFKEDRLPDEPSFYTFYPTAVDPEAAPEGESVMYVLIPCPPMGKVDWKSETEALVDKVLEAVERRAFPGLREAVRWQEVRTPEDAASDGLYQGGSFGIAPALTQSAVFRPQIVPTSDVKGLYAVGASIHPGGGIPIVMQGARLLANYMVKESWSCDDNRMFGKLREHDPQGFVHIP